MPDTTNLHNAVDVLTSRLDDLKTVVTANSFLVSVMRRHQDQLKEWDADTARTVVLALARDAFGNGGPRADAAVLRTIEASFQPVAPAKVLPFPGRTAQ